MASKKSKKIRRKLKVVTVVGTRPEIIRLSEVIKELDRFMDHTLVHTGQNYDYELNEIFFKDLDLHKPDRFLNAAGNTSAETVANVIVKVDQVLEEIQPDAFLVLGDTNSALGVYAAKRRKIPVFHMEAGNRCFDERVPEEINRRIVDHTSDINLVYSDRAREHLLREGLLPDRIIKTGSPMFEVLGAHTSAIAKSTVLKDLRLKPQKYFLMSFHREENLERKRLLNLVEAAGFIAKEYAAPVIVSTHPRTKKRLQEFGIKTPKGVQFLKPMGFFNYVHLEKNACCTLSDSGTISEESAILNFPAVNIRESHERPEAMDEGIVIMSGTMPERILQAIELALSYRYGEKRDFGPVGDYVVPNVSKKVAKIILSYTDYVERHVWKQFD